MVGYERNIWTSEKYDKAGITVLPIPGDELGRRARGRTVHELSTGTRWYLKETLAGKRRTLIKLKRWAAMRCSNAANRWADIQPRKISNWRPEPSPSNTRQWRVVLVHAATGPQVGLLALQNMAPTTLALRPAARYSRCGKPGHDCTCCNRR